MKGRVVLIVSSALMGSFASGLFGQTEQSKTGYVVEYKIVLQPNPMTSGTSAGTSADSRVYLSVLISSQSDEAVDTMRFVLIRNISNAVDVVSGSNDTWAVNYATASAAIIAALEDAFLNEKVVTVVGTVPHPHPEMPQALPFSLIKSVTLTALGDRRHN